MQRAVEIMGEDAETIAALVEGVEMVEEVEDGDAVEVVEETIAVQVLEIIALVIEHKMNLTHFKEKLTIEVRYTKNCKSIFSFSYTLYLVLVLVSSFLNQLPPLSWSLREQNIEHLDSDRELSILRPQFGHKVDMERRRSHFSACIAEEQALL